MARSRNIKPGFFTNELLGTADPMVCLTFAGLWCLADKEGILEDRPLRIKAELFPYRESLDVNGYLTDLSRLGFIQRYQHGDDGAGNYAGYSESSPARAPISGRWHTSREACVRNGRYGCACAGCRVGYPAPSTALVTA